MSSPFDNKINKVLNAIISRINNSISTHNNDNNAHASLLSSKANSSDLINIENRISDLEDELEGLEEDLLAWLLEKLFIMLKNY